MPLKLSQHRILNDSSPLNSNNNSRNNHNSTQVSGLMLDSIDSYFEGEHQKYREANGKSPSSATKLLKEASPLTKPLVKKVAANHKKP